MNMSAEGTIMNEIEKRLKTSCVILPEELGKR